MLLTRYHSKNEASLKEDRKHDEYKRKHLMYKSFRWGIKGYLMTLSVLFNGLGILALLCLFFVLYFIFSRVFLFLCHFLTSFEEFIHSYSTHT